VPEYKTGLDILTQEVSLVPPEKLRLVKDLLTFMVRTMKTMLLYPQNNPIPHEFRKNLHEKFCHYLDEYEVLKLVADQGKLLISGEVIHEDPPQEEGIALAMYRDGIREIFFQNGLKLEELENFLQAVKISLQSKSGEDDLVTLLWENDFTHLRYTVIEQASDLPEPIQLQSRTSEDFEKIYYSEITLGDQELAALEEGKPIIDLHDLASEEIARLLKNVAAFEKEELAEINSLLQIEKFYRKQAEVVPILFEILVQEEEQSGFDEALRLIEKVLDEFLAGSHFDLAAEILKQFRKQQEYFAGRSETRAQRLSLALERAGDKNRLERLVALLNQDKEAVTQQVYQYLVLLAPASIPNLIWMLGELRHFSSRKLICQALEFFAHSHLEQVAAGIHDKRWFVVRNLAMILGRTQNPKIVPYLKKTTRHADFRVRKESILALSRLNSKEASFLLIESLKDPDRKIRLYAIRALAATREKEAFEPLWREINSRGFTERGEDEIKEAFEALVLIGEEEGLQQILSYIKKFYFWQRRRHRECKLLALKSLEKSGHPGLSGYLEQIGKLKNRVIRQSARQILEHVNLRQKKREEQSVEQG
jgi:HEAT repeat protein